MRRALSGDEVWRGEIILDGDVVVPPGRTLVLEPGCVVRARSGSDAPVLQRFASGRPRPVTAAGFAHLIVLGRLVARGAAGAPVEIGGTAFGGVLVIARGRARLSHCVVRATGNEPAVSACDAARVSLTACLVEGARPLAARGFAYARLADCGELSSAYVGDDAALVVRRGEPRIEREPCARVKIGAAATRRVARPEPAHTTDEPHETYAPIPPELRPLKLELCLMTTGSMSPTLTPGDFMLVSPVERAPALGDLLLMPATQKYPQLRVHRLVRVTDGRAFLRGDANPRPDVEEFRLSETLGRVVAVGKGDGRWRRIDGPLARLAGRVAAVGFRLLDACERALGPTRRVDAALAALATAGRRLELPWRAWSAFNVPGLRRIRRGWLDVWLACERLEHEPRSSWDWLRAAWARAAAWAALGRF